MKILFTEKSLLTSNIRKKPVDGATRQRQQKDDDKKAKLFLDALYNLNRLKGKLCKGPFEKLIANAAVSIGEAAILSGMPQQALNGVAQNVFKLQDENLFPLQQLIELTIRETVVAFLFPWRESYQSCVRDYIQDWIRDEHQQFFLDLCKSYFAMSCDEAKGFEVSTYILAGYFEMYPPAQNQLGKGSKAETDKLIGAEAIDNNGALPEGGSRPESSKINATNETCSKVSASIKEGRHLDNKGRIGVDDFVVLVKTSMESQGNGTNFQKTAAKRYFDTDTALAPFKRRRGEKSSL